MCYDRLRLGLSRGVGAPLPLLGGAGLIERAGRIQGTALLALGLLLGAGAAGGQENFRPNGVSDERRNAYALTNAVVYGADGGVREGATVLIRDGRISGVIDTPREARSDGSGSGGSRDGGGRGGGRASRDTGARQGPLSIDGHFVIDMSGRHIYPGLIDIYTDYGISALQSPDDPNGRGENLLPAPRALNANDAVRADFRAAIAFSHDDEARRKLRERGFSAVLSLRPDGIARGTSALVTLGDERANESIIMPDAAAHYSLDKGSSIQNMPSSLMGAFALLRQTYLDADWFGAQEPRPFTDETLEATLRHARLPQIIEVSNWEEALSADRIGDEFGIQYIMKTAGDSYQRAALLKDTAATLIIPLDFPSPPDVADPLDAERVSLAELKHWELAPFNPRILAEHDIPFAITSGGAQGEIKDGGDFWKALRQAVANGLPRQTALDALSRVPARLLGAEELLGSIAPGVYANLLITDGDLFDNDTVLLENWIKGQRFQLAQVHDGRAGLYRLSIEEAPAADEGSGERVTLSPLTLSINTEGDKINVRVISDQNDEDEGDSAPRKATIDLRDDIISLSLPYNGGDERLRLNGWPTADGWRGNGLTPAGEPVSWTLSRIGDAEQEDDESTAETGIEAEAAPPITYPLMAYGRVEPPQQEDILIRGATVWTNEDAGTLVTDVLVRDGRIAAVGDELRAGDARIIDGEGRHLTPGIIDEHSHIALFSINERETDSSMVRMIDALESADINIYRNLAGGVTAAQLLHGSANPIGGQSAIIKMRWGEAAPGLLIEDAAPFIKFALGENVKRSTNPASIRYPQTRMGVEQVFVNAFTEAREYGRAWDEYNGLSSSARRNTPPPRRDLAREAILEVLNGERFVTSHSYVQSEINMLIHVADSFGFNINTFTHILEGYKVADKMARHGAGGSTFSDWWGYKWEVRYAIPHNAALMQQAGVVVAINSDDAEMARRLNQEAAKSVKYGGMSEVDALKLVTLNPAILLHLDERMGSIHPGKDADLVLWSDHPLSVYAIVDTTWIEGVPYYDRAEDAAMQQRVTRERARIIAAIANSETPE